MEGDDLGPSSGSTCDEWTKDPLSCPLLPTCDMHTSCSTCVHVGCSLCQSLDQCMDETYFVPCEGKVSILSGGACPSPFTSTTRVDGNLVVKGDKELLGGNIHVFGPCDKGMILFGLLFALM